MFTFSISELYKTVPLISFNIADWLFFVFLCCLRHSDSNVSIPYLVAGCTAGSTCGRFRHVAGSFLLTGAYGLVRFSIPFFPAVVADPKVRNWMIALSLIGIVYCALISLVQKDLRKLLAYLSVSQIGFCTLGIFALNSVGLTGSMLQGVGRGVLHRSAVRDHRHFV